MEIESLFQIGYDKISRIEKISQKEFFEITRLYFKNVKEMQKNKGELD